MKALRDKVAIITGAADGIGKALALQLAQLGCDLAISDINQDLLEETTQMLIEAFPKRKIHSKQLDVRSINQWEEYLAQVQQEFPEVHIMINNAGIALRGTIEGTDIESFEKVLAVNFWGALYGTKAFLPFLIKSRESCIVNISSVFGLIGVPTQAAYNASKFALRGFTEALYQELLIEHPHVNVISVHPGGIQTSIIKNMEHKDTGGFGLTPKEVEANFNKAAKTTPEQAAKEIIKGIQRKKSRVLIGRDAYFIDWAQRIFPVLYKRVTAYLGKKGGF